MNKLLLVSSMLVVSLSTGAAPRPSLMAPLAVTSLLTDIVKIKDTMIAVGERGHILRSTDGKTWQQAQVPVDVLLTDVFFLDDQRGWAVGHDVTVLATVDGGLSWVIQHYAPKLDKPLFGIHFKDVDNGIAFGAYGLFFRTTDGGKNWQKEFHGEFLHPDDLEYLDDLKANEPEAFEDESGSILPHFNRLTFADNTAYLVGEMGMVAQSSDYGVTWQKMNPFYNGSFFDIVNVPKKGLFVGGLRGNLFNKTPTQSRWQRVDVDAKTSINRIINARDRLILLGNAGLLYISADHGQTFKSLSQSDGKAITGGIFLNNKLILSTETGIKVIDGNHW